jgi:peptidoglycan/LPS O-acetylase OafA/YrhL
LTDAVDWRHVPALDGLRALAVVAVLAFHAGHLQGGFLGVDLFFALSGFLITTLLLRDGRDGSLRLRAFWGRRFRRLLPAALTLIVVVAVFAWAFGSPAELDRVRSDGPWAIVYLANWHLIDASGGYWASFTDPSMFNHLWSLAIEEQFYVVWPLVIALVCRLSRRVDLVVAVVAGALTVASVAAMLAIYDGGDPTRVYMGTDTRASSILVGAVLATAPLRRVVTSAERRFGGRVEVISVAALAGVVASWFMVDGATSRVLFDGGLAAHSTASAVVVAVTAVSAGPLSRALSWAPLQWIGRLSYSLYLWHWPVYVYLSEDRLDFAGWGLTIVRVGVSLALAAASYHLVEQPVRVRAMWARGRRGLASMATSLAVGLALFAVIPEPQGEVAAFDPATVSAPPTASPTTAGPTPTATMPVSSVSPVTVAPSPTTTPTSTSTSTTTLPATTTTAPTFEVDDVLWIGDSIAFDLAPAVIAAFQASSVRIRSLAEPGARLVPDRGVSSAIESVVHELDQQPDLPSVLVVQLSVWDAGQSSELQRGALELMRDVAASRRIPLVYVTPPVVSQDNTAPNLASLIEIATEIADDGDAVWLLDQSAVWGPAFLADLDGDGTPERKRDGVHMCPSGAARFAAWLVPALAGVARGIVPADPIGWAGGAWIDDARYDNPVGACAPL